MRALGERAVSLVFSQKGWQTLSSNLVFVWFPSDFRVEARVFFGAISRLTTCGGMGIFNEIYLLAQRKK